MTGFKVAIVGATGAVGREMMDILEEREFPVRELVPLASSRSAGTRLEFRDEELTVQALSEKALAGCDFALFSAGATVSRQWAPIAAAQGAFVIDNSSAFRREADVPLVVPEVNPDSVELAKTRRIVSNPNCSTIQMVVALKPLHDAAMLRRVVVSTYQSVSGRGQSGMAELEKQIGDLMNCRETSPEAFAHRIAFNLIPQIDDFDATGSTKEELKLVHETRRILGISDLPVSATCVRVPIFIGHSESVNLAFSRPLGPDEARKILASAPGVKVLDDPSQNIYPMPMLAAGDSAVHVGRIRKDESQENGLDLFICADNLRKGAALNAVQIAELIVQRGIVAKTG
ncbi:MAG: aspartate-semialdehyde dehydrogenase [Myxococcales bacterium]|jgi:aspartate-semialdehyde dehydrogenase|nr:aspartate-semialdehyde dehydrogenase [Myxococcales bacterium]